MVQHLAFPSAKTFSLFEISYPFQRSVKYFETTADSPSLSEAILESA